MESSAPSKSIDVLTDLLAFERVSAADGRVTLQHPNTEWRLVLHDGGPDAPPKAFHHHWGVRVVRNQEVAHAYEHLRANAAEYQLGEIAAPEYSHGSMSVYLREPGGNTWEIECFEDLLRNPKAGGSERLGGVRAPHWSEPLPESRFPGRGYVPQAFTHGTLACESVERSGYFYANVLGLEVLQAYKEVLYIKHPKQKHYVVCLTRPSERMHSPMFRNTLTFDSSEAVEAAHDQLARAVSELGITELRSLVETASGIVSFLLSDPDRNWWEFASPERRAA